MVLFLLKSDIKKSEVAEKGNSKIEGQIPQVNYNIENRIFYFIECYIRALLKFYATNLYLRTYFSYQNFNTVEEYEYY